MVNVKAVVLCCIERIVCMKVNGKMTKEKEKAWNDIQTEISMKVTSRKAKLTERVSMFGQMEKSMMVNGSMVSRKAMECGKVFLVIAILDNGKTVKLMVMVSINGRTAIDMKEPG